MTESHTLGWSHCKSSPRCVFPVTSWRWLEDCGAPLLPAKPSSLPHGVGAACQRPTVNFASCFPFACLSTFLVRLSCVSRLPPSVEFWRTTETFRRVNKAVRWHHASVAAKFGDFTAMEELHVNHRLTILLIISPSTFYQCLPCTQGHQGGQCECVCVCVFEQNRFFLTLFSVKFKYI